MSSKYASKLSALAAHIREEWTEELWGFTLWRDTEIEALRIAYALRYSAHGIQVQEIGGRYRLTVFKPGAKEAGIDGAR